MQPLSRADLSSHVTVWIARVSQLGDSLDALHGYLDDRERERAARFHFPEDRARFTLGRAMVRKGLSQILQIAAEAVSLTPTDRDRPVLAGDNTIQFSISHTHDFVVVAFAADMRIGIDVEFMERKPDLPALAKRILSEADHAKFQTLPDSEFVHAFFRIWTRKEAYLKATGEGITEGLQKISVSSGPEKVSTITDNREKSAKNTWRLINLPVPPGYKGSLACDDARKHINCSFVHFDRGEIKQDSLSTFSEGLSSKWE